MKVCATDYENKHQVLFWLSEVRNIQQYEILCACVIPHWWMAHVYAWTYDWVSSKYKLIVLAFCDIISVDVFLTIMKTSFVVFSVVDHYYGLIMLVCICQYP